MEESPMEIMETVKQQNLDSPFSSGPTQSPSVQANPEVKASIESSVKSKKKQQKVNKVENQQKQTALSKLAKKNQKQLVGENFERMNYLYQCATRLARLTTHSSHDCNCPLAHDTTSSVRSQIIQHCTYKKANSVPIQSLHDWASQDVAVIQSKNMCIEHIALVNDPSASVGSVAVRDGSSPITDTAVSARLSPGITTDMAMSAENSSHGWPVTSSTAGYSARDLTKLCSDNPLSSNTLVPCRERGSCSNEYPASNPDLGPSTNFTHSCSDMISILNCSSPGTVIDAISKTVSSCPENKGSSGTPTVPCPEMECTTTNPTSPSSKLERPSTSTESCSELDHHTNPTSSCRELASNVSSTCRAVGRKCQLRLSHHMKRELCRGCSTPLVPALTASAKIITVRKKRVLAVRCLTCGVRRMRPCQDMKTLWADRCATTV